MYPLIKAHAGAENTIENSKNSFILSVDLGADIIEIDVHVTKDNIVIGHHDPAIQGKEISSHTYEELKEVFRELATLDEIIEYAKPKNAKINIDFKVMDRFETISNVVKKYDYFENCVLSGITKNLEDAKKWFPISEIWNATPHIENGLPPYLYESYIDDCISSAMNNGCNSINLEYKSCSNLFVKKAHDQGLKVHIWTVDKQDDLEKIFAMNVDSITTNNLKLALNMRNRLQQNEACLLETDGILTPADNQTNKVFSFEVANTFDQLVINFDYSPKYISEEESKDFILHDMKQYYLNPEQYAGEQWKNFSPVSNLITLSLDMNEEFVGAAHRGNSIQSHVVSKNYASPGFIKREITPGVWCIMLNIHSLVAKECHYSLSIKGILERN